MTNYFTAVSKMGIWERVSTAGSLHHNTYEQNAAAGEKAAASIRQYAAAEAVMKPISNRKNGTNHKGMWERSSRKPIAV